MTMEIKRADILLVESPPSSFQYLDGEWDYQ
jgi:hypothetical protein